MNAYLRLRSACFRESDASRIARHVNYWESPRVNTTPTCLRRSLLLLRLLLLPFLLIGRFSLFSLFLVFHSHRLLRCLRDFSFLTSSTFSPFRIVMSFSPSLFLTSVPLPPAELSLSLSLFRSLYRTSFSLFYQYSLFSFSLFLAPQEQWTLSVGYIIGEVMLPTRAFVHEHDHQHARSFHRMVYFSCISLSFFPTFPSVLLYLALRSFFLLSSCLLPLKSFLSLYSFGLA